MKTLLSKHFVWIKKIILFEKISKSIKTQIDRKLGIKQHFYSKYKIKLQYLAHI